VRQGARSGIITWMGVASSTAGVCMAEKFAHGVKLRTTCDSNRGKGVSEIVHIARPHISAQPLCLPAHFIRREFGLGADGEEPLPPVDPLLEAIDRKPIWSPRHEAGQRRIGQPLTAP